MANGYDERTNAERERDELQRRIDEVVGWCHRGAMMVPASLVEGILRGER